MYITLDSPDHPRNRDVREFLADLPVRTTPWTYPELYARYQSWTIPNSRPVANTNQFTRILRALGWPPEYHWGVRYVRQPGVSLLDAILGTPPDDPEFWEGINVAPPAS